MKAITLIAIVAGFMISSVTQADAARRDRATTPVVITTAPAPIVSHD